MSVMPIPQPSSLVGALAYCLGVSSGSGAKAYDEVLGLVSQGRLLAARARPAEGLPLTYSAVVLRRFRIFDKGYEAKKKGEIKPVLRLKEAVSRGDALTARRILEVELMDAFYREYVMGFELVCCWVMDGVELDERALWLVSRLGDTESLCSVVRVWSEDAEVYEADEVTTSFPAPAVGVEEVRGDGFMIAKLCDEARELGDFIIPCKVGFERGRLGKYPVIRPTTVTLKYSEKVRVCGTSMGSLVLRSTRRGPKKARSRRRR